MIFAQHHEGSFVDAAQSAEGVLLLGRLGQGVGLLSDVLAAAAADCGRLTSCEELHGFERLQSLSAAAVWLGACEAPPASAGFDVVMVLDRSAIAAAHQMVKPNGRILLAFAHEEHSHRSRFGFAAGHHSTLFRSEQVFVAGSADPSSLSIGYLAGCLGSCVSLPERCWSAALESHLRPRERRTARAHFASGRRQTMLVRPGLR